MSKLNVYKEKRVVGSPNAQRLALVLILFAFWMLLSGSLYPKFVFFGIVTSVVAAWLTYPFLLIPNQTLTKNYFLLGISPWKAICYAFWITWEVFLANLDVIRATMRSEIHINPKVVKFNFYTDNPMAMVVLANSITLTPGTVTMNVQETGLFEVHALTDSAREGLISGNMQKKAAWLFDEKYYFEVVEEEA